jgi:hypothetical protein
MENRGFDGSYHCLVSPTTAALATSDAMRFFTGFSSG